METEEELKDIQKLDAIYQYAQGICDPIEFVRRQQSLLYYVCEYLLLPLRNAEEEMRKIREKEGD